MRTQKGKFDTSLPHATYYVCSSRSHPLPNDGVFLCTFSSSLILVHCTILELGSVDDVIGILSPHNHICGNGHWHQPVQYLPPDLNHCHNYHNPHHLHLPRSILLEEGENYLPLFLVIAVQLPRNS